MLSMSRKWRVYFPNILAIVWKQGWRWTKLIAVVSYLMTSPSESPSNASGSDEDLDNRPVAPSGVPEEIDAALFAVQIKRALDEQPLLIQWKMLKIDP